MHTIATDAATSRMHIPNGSTTSGLPASRSTSLPTVGSVRRPGLPATMRAIVQDRYGDADVLQLREIRRPRPAAGEVLIAVAAAGVDRGVWHLMTGLPLAVRVVGFGLRRPKQPTPGLDVAGTVVEVGPDVDDFRVGDEVYGIASGAYAEYAVAQATKLARRPVDVPVTDAATIAISGGTAATALFDVGRAEPGQRVLVLGASGGVGSWVTRLAHHHGMHVTGVASGRKADFVRGLGADVVLDYERDDFAAEAAFDLIIDIGGRNRLSKLRRALTRRGTLVIVGGEGGGKLTGGAGRQLRAMALSLFVSQRLTTFIADERATAWSRVRHLVDLGDVPAAATQTYPLADAPAALADLAAGRIAGKAVITVRP